MIAMTWHFPALGTKIRAGMVERACIYPIDKTNLDVLRFNAFSCAAVMSFVWFIPPQLGTACNGRFPPRRYRCGQHSLQSYCLGVFLAFATHFIMAEVAGGISMQVWSVSVGLRFASSPAGLLSWYKGIEARSAISAESRGRGHGWAKHEGAIDRALHHSVALKPALRLSARMIFLIMPVHLLFGESHLLIDSGGEGEAPARYRDHWDWLSSPTFRRLGRRLVGVSEKLYRLLFVYKDLFREETMPVHPTSRTSSLNYGWKLQL